MPLMQLLLTAVSLSAAAGGTWGAERLMDRYARIPDPAAEAVAEPDEETGEDEAEPGDPAALS
jgi:hypothetical protein